MTPLTLPEKESYPLPGLSSEPILITDGVDAGQQGPVTAV